ncbi:hypothetical protein SeMB42_g07891 [Synchytrium endobioticum]|uniref:Uncharacterized protein n=1 Tax=Synchytrium endobioticum TaxID=286115 RepID=A0A507BSJ1_9FUNG|nr:hypothetical protein SeMB42_g07891 [Synchytrium endobioticum]
MTTFVDLKVLSPQDVEQIQHNKGPHHCVANDKNPFCYPKPRFTRHFLSMFCNNVREIFWLVRSCALFQCLFVLLLEQLRIEGTIAHVLWVERHVYHLDEFWRLQT